MAQVASAVASAAVDNEGFEAYLKDVCLQLVDVLSSLEISTTASPAMDRNERIITFVLNACGKMARYDWQRHRKELESLVRAAPRCCWRPSYCTFLAHAIEGASQEIVDSVAVMDGIDAFCHKIPEAFQSQNTEVQEFCAKVSRILVQARAQAQTAVQPRRAHQLTVPINLYEQQIRRLTRVAEVLGLLDMPTAETFLFPPPSSTGLQDAEPAGLDGELKRLPLSQTWHPISMEQGWYHLLVQFLLLRGDCASGLRNAVSCVNEAFVTAAVRQNVGSTVPVSAVIRELQVLRKRRDKASLVRPYWNATWVGVGYHTHFGLVCVVELEMPIRSQKRLLNDNIVLLSKRYFDRASPIYVGLIRSLPREHMEQQTKVLDAATEKTFLKRFAFQVLNVLGPAVPFPTEAADGAPFCVVESPVLYSAYSASLMKLKEMLESAFRAVGNAVWPRSSGLPLEGALLAGLTADAPAYMANCTALLSVENSIVVRGDSAPLVDACDAASWDRVCQEWSESEEAAAKRRSEENPLKRRCHLLDSTQRAALRHVFSHRVALVQGTPGTGKSFVGFKFIQIVLENYKKLLPGPIVVTAVTNHALDAVLEEVLRHMEDTDTYEPGAILRLGGGSKLNPVLKDKCDFEDFTRSATREVRAVEEELQQVVKSCTLSFYERVSKTFPSVPGHMSAVRSLALQRLLPDFSGHGGFTNQTIQLLSRVLTEFPPTDSASQQRVRRDALVTRLLPLFSSATANTAEGLLQQLRDAEPYLACSTAGVFAEWCRWDKHQRATPKRLSKWQKKQGGKASLPWSSKLPELQRQMAAISPAGSPVPPQLATALRHARDVLKRERDINNVPLFRETDNRGSYAGEDFFDEVDESDDGDEAAAVADVRVTQVSASGSAALSAAVKAAQTHMSTLASLLSLSKGDRSLLLDAVPDDGRVKIVEAAKRIAESPLNNEYLKLSNLRIAQRMASQMKHAKVVGGTVNALLKEQEALALVKPRILLVEEAGQVLEGQLIASLSEGLEHLLLIGDHRQLPPQPEEYVLDKKGLGVSLMERLVRSGAPYETLTTQRRMHPEVSQLIHGYYKRVDPEKPVQIEDHPSTHLRPPPLGVRDGMRTLMVSYNPEEDSSKQELQNGDMGSYSNTYEADLCAAMASHLAMYNPQKSIIVLSYYSQQRQLIAQKMPSHLLQSGVVKVRTVDDFQGEEEDFVILSTVRTAKPGFVKEESRACVSLSRARMACYVVGCAAVLQQSCGVFVDLLETLTSRANSGVLEHFPACCSIHNKPMTFCSQKELAATMCTAVCNMLEGQCGHVCKKTCHGPVHEKCYTKLREPCAYCQQHRTYLCYEKTTNLLGPCTNTCVVSGPATLCGHQLRAPCHAVHDNTISVERRRRQLSDSFCKEACRAVMPCGHVCKRQCHAATDVNHAFQQLQCMEMVTAAHPGCGHPTFVPCNADRENPNTYGPCKERCGKSLACGHLCTQTCGHNAVCVCSEWVTMTLPCGHQLRRKCNRGRSAPRCDEKCTHTHSSCGHPCSGVCGECTTRRSHAPCAPCADFEALRLLNEVTIQRITASLEELTGSVPSTVSPPPDARSSTPAVPPKAPAPRTTSVTPVTRDEEASTHSSVSARSPNAPNARDNPHQDLPEPKSVVAQPSAPFRTTAVEEPQPANVLQQKAHLPRSLTDISYATKVQILEMQLEHHTLQKTLCERLKLPIGSFTCDVNPEADWSGVDTASSEALKDVLPLLKEGTHLSASSGDAALSLVEKEYEETCCAPLLRALVYSSRTHIADFKEDAVQYLRMYVEQQQRNQRPLLMSLVLLVVGRVYGGLPNVPLYSSCVCRARVDPAAEELLDPRTESFTQPLKVLSAVAQSCGAGGAAVKKDRWASLKGMVSTEAIKTANKLERMIGLEGVKQEVFEVCNTIVRERKLPPESRVPQTFNFVLQGNPGTGKTSVARLLGKLLHEMEVREKDTFIETTGEKLARGGSVAAAQLFDDAADGVLFIDEAYAMDAMKGGEGAAIAMQLLQVAEDRRENLTIILAGYKEDLGTKLFEFNDGFARRFPFTFSFEDYSDAELEQIFRKYCAEFKWTPIEDAAVVAARRVGRGRGRKGFGNAGAVRVCFEAAYRRAMERTKGGATELLREDVMGPRPSRTTPPDLALALTELEEMIGLRSVKEKIMGMVSVAEHNYDLELEGREPHLCTLNRVFLGNPGTGKTTVAKLYGRILKGLGWLSKGEWELRQPGDIIKGYVGQSEEAMAKLLAQCQGKLLILDEAYQLHENTTFGPAAISTLVSKVHGEPGEDIGVVLIGYHKEMNTMLRESNPGLKRRFDLDNAFVFDDYTKEELERLMARLAAKKKVTLPPELRRRVVNEIDKARTSDNFGNAGVVTQAMSSAMTRMLARDIDARTFVLGDFGLRDTPPDVESSLACLDGMYQVEHIKEYVRGMAASIRQREVDGEPRSDSVVNYIFTGSPGTGKTTVARAMGKVLACLRCLERDKVVETSGQQMIGSYLGQTKDKVTKLMDDAEGGILFIDEAYSMCESGAFGAEAVASLVELMTSKKHYRRTVVIMAGYTSSMDRLLQLNEGLRSRFAETLNFPDWGVEDGLSFVRLRCAKERLDLHPDDAVMEELRTVLSTTVGRPGWGNARSCMTLLDELKNARASRLGGAREKPKQIALGDAERACRKFSLLFPFTTTTAVQLTAAHVGAAAVQGMPRIVPHVLDAVVAAEEVGVAPAGTMTETAVVGQAVASHSDEDIFFTALLAACKAAGYDNSHERRKELVALLEASQRGTPLPDTILQQIVRDTGRPASVVMAALKPQIPTVLLGMRNAVRAQEEVDAHLALLEEEERQQKIRTREAVRKRLIALCPAGYQWFECGSGWRCGGGSHYVSNDQLPKIDV